MIKASARFACLVSFVFASACHETGRLVSYQECEPGHTAQCTSDNQCTGVQKCSADAVWGSCELPAGTPASCIAQVTPAQCDAASMPEEDKPCYTGPAGTKWKGICRPGYEVCSKESKLTCAFQQTPQARNCSNGLDNDCDGTVDEQQGTNVQATADVVLFIDESGSMVPYIEVVKQAIIQFAASNTSSNKIRIAAVGVPHGTDGYCGLITNFTDPANAGSIIDSLMITYLGFGDEPTIDCPYLAADPQNPLDLQYRPGVKRTFISFTDEYAQSYKVPAVTATQAGQRMAAQNIQFFSFDRLEDRPTYKQMTSLTGGRSFELQRPYSAIQQDLVSLFLQILCTN